MLSVAMLDTVMLSVAAPMSIIYSYGYSGDMTFRIMTLMITTLSITTKRDSQENGSQHSGNVVMLSVIYAKCYVPEEKKMVFFASNGMEMLSRQVLNDFELV
jgi:hypothetical protein